LTTQAQRNVRMLTVVLALACGFSPAPAAAQVIAGRVVDAQTGGGVAGARVTAAGVGHDDTRRTLTAADGRYAIEVRGGSYRVQATRTGYQPASDTVTVVPGDTSRVMLRLSPAPRQLAAVDATTRPRRLPMSGGFLQVYPTDSLLAAERTRVEGGRGRVLVRGVMVTPTPCWRLAGAADRVGPLITLNIQARLYYGGCPPDAAGASTYKVTLRGIPPGTYTVRVLHTYTDERYPPSVAIDSGGVTVRCSRLAGTC
jgi:hypothetical protein